MEDKKFDPPLPPSRIARNGPTKSHLQDSWIPNSQRPPKLRITRTSSWTMGQSSNLAMGVYCGVAVSLALATKYTVSGLYWNLNFFLLFVQSSLTVVVMGGLRYMGVIEGGAWFDRRKALTWMPLSLLLVLKGYISLKALQCLSLPTYTILTNFETIVLAQTESIFSGGGFMTASFALMIIGGAGAVWSDYDIAMASYGDRRLVQTLEPIDPVLDLIIGCILMVVSIFLSSIHSTFKRRINKKTNLKDWDAIWYNNILILPISGTLSYLIEDFSSENLNDNFPPSYRISTIISLLSIGLLTPLLTYTSFHCTKISGEKKALFMKEAVNKLFSAICGLLVFGRKGDVTDDGVLAVGVAGLGGWMFVWARFGERGGRGEGLLPTSSLNSRAVGSGSKDYL